MTKSLLGFPELLDSPGRPQPAAAAPKDPLRDAALQVVAELRALPPDEAINLLCGWLDVDHAHYIGAFIFEALMAHQGHLFDGDVGAFLDFSVQTAAQSSPRAAGFPHEALADARARIDTTAPDVDCLYRLFSLLERQELMNVGF